MCVCCCREVRGELQLPAVSSTVCWLTDPSDPLCRPSVITAAWRELVKSEFTHLVDLTWYFRFKQWIAIFQEGPQDKESLWRPGYLRYSAGWEVIFHTTGQWTQPLDSMVCCPALKIKSFASSFHHRVYFSRLFLLSYSVFSQNVTSSFAVLHFLSPATTHRMPVVSLHWLTNGQR